MNANEQNTSLVRKTLENTLAIGGLSDLMKATELPMLLIDTSGSMEGRPIELLRAAVTQIQAGGQIAMIAFGGPYDAQVRFVDVVPAADGGTPLHVAIPFAKEYGATRLVVISDGQPDLRDESMNQAKLFGGRIDVVYVGHEGDGGSLFLEALAKSTGGTRLQGDLAQTKELAATVIGLLDGEVAPTGRVFTTDASGGAVAEEADLPEPKDEEDDEEDTDEDEDDEDDEDEDEDDED
jgi:hypothetical protein